MAVTDAIISNTSIRHRPADILKYIGRFIFKSLWLVNYSIETANIAFFHQEDQNSARILILATAVNPTPARTNANYAKKSNV